MTFELAAAGGGAPEGIELFIPPVYDIVWSAVVFFVILFFFWKFAVPKFSKVLDERSAAIEGNIEKAESAQAEAAAQLEKYNELLAEARSEAGRIREQARLDGITILNELKEQAAAEAARLTANAATQIEAERQAALASLRSEVGVLALDLASSVIGSQLSDDKKAAALVDSFLADLESSESSAGK
ncbi:F0F1 ATP synthase subunit B [Salinibacterium sp. dk2585]|uniref:F0F1 ATP synthase subunit B n=1 Tax=unclassified Salinibacterium TaxID=2632331 RepID=UPI0011C24F80|nr:MULTISPECIES: F0F1 ATP synthase subunit B [unclassified Salinibacterium]QEE61752.1 F0F1 ATP synthase subunit B [Salinibacterium sp. dk2585]TXK54693.1 F0F1 ATP synthase subunit B [Salinibacterium sp. dk5596]